jgi:hypothetical protein
MARVLTYKTCVFCERQTYRLAARGLCPACYYRAQRNGTPDYTKVRKPCTVKSCDELSIAKGYCETHYRRFKRFGVVEGEKFERYGHIEHHPLKSSHRWFKARTQGGVVTEWADFWTFAAAVGARPGVGYKLRKLRKDEPMGPDNFVWVAPIVGGTVEQVGGRNSYARAYRAANPEKFKVYDLKRAYGMSAENYTAMVEGQGNVCAVCKRPENAVDPKTGASRALAVDHCHASGKVRALLCSACNTGLGLFGDDAERLRAAADYVELHRVERQWALNPNTT